MSTPAADVGLITSLLRRHRLLDDDDIVFVGGSVADGLATPSSDVDVFVIHHEANMAASELHLVPMPHDEMPMDLEVWSSAEVNALLRKLNEVGENTRADHRAFMHLTEDERDFLHSLVCAIPAHNESALRQLQAQVDRGLLARLSLARALLGITNSQTDLLGWLLCGDWQSAATACQRILEFAALVMLGASGCTHPGGKWVTALLRDRFRGKNLPPPSAGRRVKHRRPILRHVDQTGASGSNRSLCTSLRRVLHSGGRLCADAGTHPDRRPASANCLVGAGTCAG